MPSGAFLRLPLELLREIMSHLSLDDIMSLKRSCRPLSRMVYEPALRSYHSRMREAGLRDRPPPDGLSIRERLAALDRWESAWDNAYISIAADSAAQQQDQQQVVEIAGCDPDSRVLVVEGFYVEMHPLADGRADGCGYRYLDLAPSSLRQEDVCSVWHAFQQRVGILCYAFAIEKYDLFAVLIEAPWLSNHAALQLLNFHDGQPHPLVRQNQPIRITDRGDRSFCVSKMHVVDDHILIVLTLDVPERPESWMTLVDLKDQSVTPIDASFMHFLNDVAILSHDMIALVNPVDHTLELCRLDMATATLRNLRTLGLPPSPYELALFRVSTPHGATADPPPGYASPSHIRSSSLPTALFYGDPEQAITCIALHYTTKRTNSNNLNAEWFEPEERSRRYLVTRHGALSVLAATCAVADDDDAHQAQAQDALAHTPWFTWSPAVEAQLLPQVLPPVGFGAHATLHERLFLSDDGTLSHFDFNPYRARAALGQGKRERHTCAPGIESLCGGKCGALTGEGCGVTDGYDNEDGDGGDDAPRRENRSAGSGEWGGSFAVAEDALPYRSSRIMLPDDSDVYFGMDRIVRVVKFGQGELPGGSGDEALVCRRVIVHPMTG